MGLKSKLILFFFFTTNWLSLKKCDCGKICWIVGNIRNSRKKSPTDGCFVPNHKWKCTHAINLEVCMFS